VKGKKIMKKTRGREGTVTIREGGVRKKRIWDGTGRDKTGRGGPWRQKGVRGGPGKRKKKQKKNPHGKEEKKVQKILPGQRQSDRGGG